MAGPRLAAGLSSPPTPRLGVFVANLAWRDPVLMARSIIALDQFSRGRFALGVGSGRFADQVMKGALDMTGEDRIARFDEGLVVLDRLLRQRSRTVLGSVHHLRASPDGAGLSAEPAPAADRRRAWPAGPEGCCDARRCVEFVRRLEQNRSRRPDRPHQVAQRRVERCVHRDRSRSRDYWAVTARAQLGRRSVGRSGSADPSRRRAPGSTFDEVVFYRPGPNRDDDFERTASTCSHLCVDASRAVGITRDERPYWRRGARATIERRGPVFDEATFGGWRE